MSKDKIKYFIKFVYPNWFAEKDRDSSIGFNIKYKGLEFVKGGKILIFLRDHKRLVGAYTILSNQLQEEARTPPLRLTIQKNYNILDDNGSGVGNREIIKVVPDFYPYYSNCYHPISEEQYLRLEKKLRQGK